MPTRKTIAFALGFVAALILVVYLMQKRSLEKLEELEDLDIQIEEDT